MSTEKKTESEVAALVGDLIGGLVVAWEASYAFYWLFGVWLQMWPLVAIAAYSAVLAWSADNCEKKGKPRPWTTSIFGQVIGMIWFMCWMATFSPLHFPLLVR